MLLDSKLVFDFSQKTPERTPPHPILSVINYITSSFVSSSTKCQVGKLSQETHLTSQNT